MTSSPRSTGGLEESVEPVAPAVRRAHLVVVDDVVAVHAPLAGLGDGGEVEVADAEPFEVGQERLGLGEAEVGLELEAVASDHGGG